MIISFKIKELLLLKIGFLHLFYKIPKRMVFCRAGEPEPLEKKEEPEPEPLEKKEEPEPEPLGKKSQEPEPVKISRLLSPARR